MLTVSAEPSEAVKLSALTLLLTKSRTPSVRPKPRRKRFLMTNSLSGSKKLACKNPGPLGCSQFRKIQNPAGRGQHVDDIAASRLACENGQEMSISFFPFVVGNVSLSPSRTPEIPPIGSMQARFQVLGRFTRRWNLDEPKPTRLGWSVASPESRRFIVRINRGLLSTSARFRGLVTAKLPT